MIRSKKFKGACIAGAALLCTGLTVWAATEHYSDATQIKSVSKEWSSWVNEWNSVATDYTKVSLTPGCAQTEVNFAWYNQGQATPVVHFGTDKNNLQAYTGTSGNVDGKYTDNVAYSFNYVTVPGLKENTTYYYTVEKGGSQSEVKTYKTGSFSSVKILYVGDPQIGASKGQTQSGEKLVNTSGVANTAARNDGYSWNRTLEAAVKNNSNINFMISAGDQVNKTGKAKEEEYASYLSPEALTGLPVATTIGNHDSLNTDYKFHFNNPNPTENGKTQAGGDYYYTYGSGLFIVLNTNNYNVAEHEATVKQAVASNPNAKWKVVTIHQDIYGSGLDHSDTDGMILRTQLTPVFDKYDIDVVLQGHDHTYSRTKILKGDGQAHGTYEFRLNETGSDYDWAHAYNTQNSQSITLEPAADDTAANAAKDAFTADNKCYTITSSNGSSVTNPDGILYMTANSASGSKYYELISTQQDYVANRSQNWLPSYSIIDMTSTSFTINTYQVKEDGNVEKIDNAFTIYKN